MRQLVRNTVRERINSPIKLADHVLKLDQQYGFQFCSYNTQVKLVMNQLSNLNSIKGSLNLVTGCGSGLGRATMQRLIKNGCEAVLGIDRQFEPDYERNLGLDEKERKRVMLRTYDTFDEKVETSMLEFVKLYGTIHNVINVAGVALAFLLYSKTTKTIYDQKHAQNLVEFNTVGTFNIIRLAAKVMSESCVKENNPNQPRCIINTSCISTSSPSLGQSFYVASKSSLDSMTLCMAREFSPFNIRCNTINVGYFDTNLLGPEVKVKEYLASKVALCPKKLGEPEEFAHLVQTIIENQMLNGCCIKIDAAAKEAL